MGEHDETTAELPIFLNRRLEGHVGYLRRAGDRWLVTIGGRSLKYDSRARALAAIAAGRLYVKKP